MRFFYGENMELTKEYAALIAACGVFAGTLINSFMNYLQNRKKLDHEWRSEKNRRKIEKGEQLYEALIFYKKMLFANHMGWIDAIDGKLKLNELNGYADKVFMEHPEYKGVGDRIVLISGVYFPELSVMFNDARKLLEPANSILFKIQRNDIDDAVSARRIIINAGQMFDTEADRILRFLSEEIRAL